VQDAVVKKRWGPLFDDFVDIYFFIMFFLVGGWVGLVLGVAYWGWHTRGVILGVSY